MNVNQKNGYRKQEKQTVTVQVRKLVDRELQEPLFDVFLWGVLFKYKTKF